MLSAVYPAGISKSDAEKLLRLAWINSIVIEYVVPLTTILTVNPPQPAWEVLKQTMPADSLPVLTKREKEILGLIAEGMTNQEIADKLFLTCSTVDTHRKHMLTKFKVKNTAALVKIAVSNHLI